MINMYSVINEKAQNLLSIDECYKILNEENAAITNFKILDREFEVLGGHPGFLGDYVKLRIKTSDGNIYNYFIKSKPLENEPLRQVIDELGIFRKEIGVYTQIFTKFVKNEGWYFYIVKPIKSKCHYLVFLLYFYV